MTKDRLFLLITKRLNGEISLEQVSELDDWANESARNRELLYEVTNEKFLEQEIQQWKNIDPVAGHSRWAFYMQTRRKVRIRRIAGLMAAASLLVAVIAMSIIKTPVHSGSNILIATAPTILPGRNTAVLTLANGQKLLLDSANTGVLVTQGNTRLIKLDSGSLSYAVGSGKDDIAAYNVLTTPHSGQYQVILPDGSHVWLNNVSSLRYPTSFRGKDRTVELSGEGYFEIKKDLGKPFVVKVNSEEVEVLGTSFNVMAYADEATTQTTLLEGKVRVNAAGKVIQLQPDEQVQLDKSGTLKKFTGIASQDIISWKNGFFNFDRSSLQEVMRQLSRWYDIEVKYEGAVPEGEFSGKIDRSLTLNELLKFLDKNDLHFRLEGRTLIVLPS